MTPTQELTMKLKVLVLPEADGGYSVSVPAMPGCFSEGDTLDEALVNIREAAELWVESQTERATDNDRQPADVRLLQEIEL